MFFILFWFFLYCMCVCILDVCGLTQEVDTLQIRSILVVRHGMISESDFSAFLQFPFNSVQNCEFYLR